MEDHCAIMKDLSGSVLLRVTLIFSLITSLVAFPLVIFAFYSLSCAKASKLFHINVIIIFQMHLLGFFFHCFSRIVLHSLDLYNYAFLDYCDMTPSTMRCFSFRIMYVGGLWVIGATTVPLIIERIIATKKSSSYEHTGCAIGIAMIVLHLLIAFIPTYLIFQHFNFQQPVMNYCMGMKQDKVGDSEKISILFLVLQVLSRIIFHYLFKMNENLRKEQLTSSLSNRYSLEQNLKSMRTLKRFADLQAVFMVIHTTIFIFILKFGPQMAKSTYISMVELNAQYPLYAIVSIVLILKKAHLNRVKLKKTLALHVQTDKSVYFEKFQKDLNW